ncbi:MAG: LapA family protein [Comamonas sp.]|nr:LapA family protein [Candidatus Comamonas equi]
MKSRIALLTLIIVVIGVLAFFNFPYLSQNVAMSLGFTTVQAPLGLILVGLTALMAIVFVAYVIAMQGAWLLEARAHAKEMAAQRELADKAEASRFTELRIAIENLHREEEQRLVERMDRLEAHLHARAQESDNSTAAYVGQLEQQLRTAPVDVMPKNYGI